MFSSGVSAAAGAEKVERMRRDGERSRRSAQARDGQARDGQARDAGASRRSGRPSRTRELARRLGEEPGPLVGQPVAAAARTGRSGGEDEVYPAEPTARAAARR